MVLGVYKFYLKGTATGGSVGWSPHYTITIVCDPATTTITSPVITTTQFVDKNTASTMFVMPAFTVSPSDCPIDYSVASSSGSLVTSVVADAFGSKILQISPTDTSVDA
jgi:hypothetical protein